MLLLDQQVDIATPHLNKKNAHLLSEIAEEDDVSTISESQKNVYGKPSFPKGSFSNNGKQSIPAQPTAETPLDNKRRS